MKKLCELVKGARFLYGGMEWVKIWTESEDGGIMAIAADIPFERAFDTENCNDWRKSSLRRELNGDFLNLLVREGADRAAFLDFESDLTADDGMTDYGTATDKIALLSDNLYRKFRGLIPKTGGWCWNLTPWTCDQECSHYVRNVNSSGALSDGSACNGNRGVRPICCMKSEILVLVRGEEDQKEERNSYDEAVQDAKDDVLNVLNAYPADIWGDALGAAVASVFAAKIDAEGVRLEDNARRALE